MTFITLVGCNKRNQSDDIISEKSSIELTYYDQGSGIEITENKLEIIYHEDYENYKVIESYDIVQETKNNLLYITFDYDGSFLDSPSRTPTEYPHGRITLLIIYTLPYAPPGWGGDEQLIMYDKNNEYVYSIYSGRMNIKTWDTYISATSELKKGSVVYEAKSLWDYRTLKPWVEGVKGSGVGEKIRIEYDAIFRFHGILLSNGFIDFNKPHLFLSNNRVKRIKVTFGDTEAFEEFDIEDNPNFQVIFFEGGENVKFITMEILDTYKGSRYDDTCINNIITLAY
jgi:hypothetical protein